MGHRLWLTIKQQSGQFCWGELGIMEPLCTCKAVVQHAVTYCIGLAKTCMGLMQCQALRHQARKGGGDEGGGVVHDIGYCTRTMAVVKGCSAGAFLTAHLCWVDLSDSPVMHLAGGLLNPGLHQNALILALVVQPLMALKHVPDVCGEVQHVNIPAGTEYRCHNLSQWCCMSCIGHRVCLQADACGHVRALASTNVDYCSATGHGFVT